MRRQFTQKGLALLHLIHYLLFKSNSVLEVAKLFLIIVYTFYSFKSIIKIIFCFFEQLFLYIHVIFLKKII